MRTCPPLCARPTVDENAHMSSNSHELQTSLSGASIHPEQPWTLLAKGASLSIPWAAVRAFLLAVLQRALPWIVPVGLIISWQISSSLGWLSTRVLPAPVDVASAAWTLTLSGDLWLHVKVSAARALSGLAVGGGLGLALGLLTGSVRWAE